MYFFMNRLGCGIEERVEFFFKVESIDESASSCPENRAPTKFSWTCHKNNFLNFKDIKPHYSNWMYVLTTKQSEWKSLSHIVGNLSSRNFS